MNRFEKYMDKINKQRFGFEPQCTDHGWVLSFNTGSNSVYFGQLCQELLNRKPQELVPEIVEFGAYPPKDAWGCPHFLFKEDVELLVEEFVEPRLLALKMAGWEGGKTSLWREYWRRKNG